MQLQQQQHQPAAVCTYCALHYVLYRQYTEEPHFPPNIPERTGPSDAHFEQAHANHMPIVLPPTALQGPSEGALRAPRPGRLIITPCSTYYDERFNNQQQTLIGFRTPCCMYPRGTHFCSSHIPIYSNRITGSPWLMTPTYICTSAYNRETSARYVGLIYGGPTENRTE